ncbi:uncharacterized protein LOC132543650 [Ylistrum balloti]|uniref:uncharacterized protein LOC132543650 n=1 Tax=Ylistrum balloti TaxID=509963 RepID=UPI002905C584|nr:uncharacterized protein LOC132543650 [Ylistrum balloti]
MKIRLNYPDLTEVEVRLSERRKRKVSSLLKRLPPDSVIKRWGKTIASECLISKAFTDGAIVEVVRKSRIRTRRLWNGVKRSTEQCMITLARDEPRAQMPCGHAITPQALYDYCWHELEKGSSAITCPYVTTIKGDKCGSKWDSYTVQLSAAMSKTEKKSFQTKLDKNRIKQQEIESTNVYPDDIMISLLHKSPKLRGCSTALMRRACPKCWSVIEHVAGCLTMTCQYPSCQYRFCFRCLGNYVSGIDHNRCHQAPLQFSTDE